MNTTEQLKLALANRYEVERLIGEGGMATVYLARDKRHNRKVALKLLKPDLGAVLGVERFLSEIQVTANLQHPNLLPLFDSGAVDGLLYYVMPYIEGESLRARLQREKQLPIADAIHISVAVAGALDYAHRHGVIHRDLKPENILLHEGEPLVADFGIALAVSNAGGGRITQTGLSLGTPQYMSPEQATGDRGIDGRTDIYSLGAVTYEMLTGDPPHTGSTSQAIIARVLTEKPRGVRISRPTVSLQVEAAVDNALQKLPADRWATAREFSEALTGARSVTLPLQSNDLSSVNSNTLVGQNSHRNVAREIAPWLVAAAGIAAAAFFATRNPPAKPLSMQLPLQMPDSFNISPSAGPRVALSRDGSQMVLVGMLGTKQVLYVRRMNDLGMQAVPGTEGANTASFSPDGAWLLFTLNGRQMRIPNAGGSAQLIAADASQGSWADDGRIVFVRDNALWTVSAEGGEPQKLIAPDTASRIVRFYLPEALPGGHAALVTIFKGQTVDDSARLAVVSLDDGKVTELKYEGVPVVGGNPRYANGRILFGRIGGLVYSAPFSVQKAAITGPIARVIDDVANTGTLRFDLGVAENGTLAYLRGNVLIGREIVAISRSGEQRVIGVKPGLYQTPRLSPNGLTIAASIAGQRDAVGSDDEDIWLFDTRSTIWTRFTTDAASYRPMWSADGERIAFTRPGDASVVMWRPVFASGPAAPLIRSTMHIADIGIGQPGGYIAMRINGGVNGSTDVWIAPMDSLAPPRALLNESYNESLPRISPDGKLIAYVTNRTNRSEVYVRSIVGDGSETRISTDGGTEPVWSPTNSRELFYRAPGRLMAAQLGVGARFEVAKRDSLFADTFTRNSFSANYDVYPGGKELLMVRTLVATSKQQSLIILVNWTHLRDDGARKP